MSTDSNPPTTAIPSPSDKKLVKLSKLIPEPLSFVVKLLETIVDITVFVKDRPPNIKIINIVIKKGVVSTNSAANRKLIDNNIAPIVNTNIGPFLSTSIPPK